MRIYKVKKSFRQRIWEYKKGYYALVSDNSIPNLEKKHGKDLDFVIDLEITGTKHNQILYTQEELLKLLEFRRLKWEIRLDRINKAKKAIKEDGDE